MLIEVVSSIDYRIHQTLHRRFYPVHCNLSARKHVRGMRQTGSHGSDSFHTIHIHIMSEGSPSRDSLYYLESATFLVRTNSLDGNYLNNLVVIYLSW